MTAVAAPAEGIVRWRYAWWALLAPVLMIAAIAIGNLWLLSFVHVFSSLLWTGIDLFMGFVLGPILRRVDLPVRREIVRRLTPRTLFLMPRGDANRHPRRHDALSHRRLIETRERLVALTHS